MDTSTSTVYYDTSIELCGPSIILEQIDRTPPVVNLLIGHHSERHNDLGSLLFPKL